MSRYDEKSIAGVACVSSNGQAASIKASSASSSSPFIRGLEKMWRAYGCHGRNPSADCFHFIDVVFSYISGSKTPRKIDWKSLIHGMRPAVIDKEIKMLDEQAESLLEYAKQRVWHRKEDLSSMGYITLMAMMEGDAASSDNRRRFSMRVEKVIEDARQMSIYGHRGQDFLEGKKWLDGGYLVINELDEQNQLAYPVTQASLLAVSGLPFNTIAHLSLPSNEQDWRARHKRRLLALASEFFPKYGIYYQNDINNMPDIKRIMGRAFVLFHNNGNDFLQSYWTAENFNHSLRIRCPNCGSFMSESGGKLYCPRCDTGRRKGFSIPKIEIKEKNNHGLEINDGIFNVRILKPNKRLNALVGLYNQFSQLTQLTGVEATQKQRKRLQEAYNQFVAEYGALHSEENEKWYRLVPSLRRLLILERQYDQETGEVLTSAILNLGKPWNNGAGERELPISTGSDIIQYIIRDTGRINPGRMAKVLQEHPRATYARLLRKNSGVLVYCEGSNTAHKILPAAAAASGYLVKRTICTCAEAAVNKMFASACFYFKRVLKEILKNNPDIVLSGPQTPNEVWRKMQDLDDNGEMDVQIQKTVEASFLSVLPSSIGPLEQANALAIATLFFQSLSMSPNVRISDMVPFLKKLKDRNNGKNAMEINYLLDFLEENGDTAQDLLSEFRKYQVNKIIREAGLNDTQSTDFSRDIFDRAINLYISPEVGTLSDYAPLPPLGPDIPNLYSHQKDVVAQALLARPGDKGMAIYHSVGWGKTYSMSATIAAALYHGAAKRVLVVVPNSITHQFAEDLQRAIPGARSVIADPEVTKVMPRFWEQISASDWDVIIASESVFANQIKVRKEDKEKGDTSLEELGVDMLVVDEAHHYRNAFSLSMSVKDDDGNLTPVYGLTSSPSSVSRKMVNAAYFVRRVRAAQKQHGAGVIFATATPIVNGITDIISHVMALGYGDDSQESPPPPAPPKSITPLFRPRLLVSPSVEPDPAGDGLRKVMRVAGIRGGRYVTNAAHTLMDPNKAGIVLPPSDEGVIRIEPTEKIREIKKELLERAKAIRGGSGLGNDNILAVMGDMDKYSLMPSAYHADNETQPQSPLLDDVANEVKKIYDTAIVQMPDGKQKRYAQLVFVDWGTPHNEPHSNAYLYLQHQLEDLGIPPEEIAFYHQDNPDGKDLETIRQEIKEGKIKVVITSTNVGGEGLNVQDVAVAVHHATIPWNAARMEQREGRVKRPGSAIEELNEMKEEYRRQGIDWEPRFADGSSPRVFIRTYVMPGMGSYRLWLVSVKRKLARVLLEGGVDENGILSDPSASIPSQDILNMAIAEAMDDEKMKEWLIAKVEKEYWERVRNQWERKAAIRATMAQSIRNRLIEKGRKYKQLTTYRQMAEQGNTLWPEVLGKLQSAARTADKHRFKKGFRAFMRKRGKVSVRLVIKNVDDTLNISVATPWGITEEFVPIGKDTSRLPAIVNNTAEALWQRQIRKLDEIIAKEMQEKKRLSDELADLDEEQTFPYQAHMEEAQRKWEVLQKELFQ